MSDVAFEEFAGTALTLSYEQRLNLLMRLANSLKNNSNLVSDISPADEYVKMVETISRSNMNVMWEELKNDTW